MTLYYYDKKPHHTSLDTDKLIGESIRRYLSIDGEILVMRQKNGKPYVDKKYGVCVGVTHTDRIIIIAVSHDNFGIDCEETTRKVCRFERICEKYFSENEKKCVYESTEKNNAFLDIWVKKEAYVKFSGAGLSGMKSIDVTSVCGFEKIENDKNLIIYTYKEQNNE